MSGLSEQQAKVLDVVLARSATDREFRRQLLTDPRRAIREACGVDIPPAFRLRFIERGPEADALVVLPDFETGGDESGELSDAELESVAGGAGDIDDSGDSALW